MNLNNIKTFSYFVDKYHLQDNVVLRISSDGANELDGSDGVIESYDISTYRNNAAQATAANRPVKGIDGFVFDGSTDHMNILNDGSLNPTKEITLACWFNATTGGISNNKPLIQKAFTSHTDPFYQYSLRVRDNAGDRYTSFTVNTDIGRISSTANNMGGVFDYNEWVFVVGTYDLKTLKSYINGTLIKEEEIISNELIGYNTPVGIAHYPNLAKNSTYCYGGKLNDATVLNKALSPAQVEEMYLNGESYFGEPFKILVDTTISDSTGLGKIGLPLRGHGMIIDWGDGNTEVVTQTGNDTTLHTYDTAGIYEISISGGLYEISYGISGPSVFADKQKPKQITQWGDIKWVSFNFDNCHTLIGNFTDTPDLSKVTNIAFAFNNCYVFNSDIGNWDVSNITNMGGLFYGCSSFNQDLSGWCVEQIATKPLNFDVGANAWVLPQPNWGDPC